MLFGFLAFQIYSWANFSIKSSLQMEISHTHLLNKAAYPHLFVFQKVSLGPLSHFHKVDLMGSRCLFEMAIKMENLIKMMQHPTNGVPVKPQKLFLTTIANAFTGMYRH